MPLDILDDTKLHVSVSQVKTWLRCPRQYEFTYVRGAEPEVVPNALAFGGAFHAALAAHYVKVRDGGGAATLDECIHAFDDAWRVRADEGVPIEPTEADHRDTAARMLAAFLAAGVGGEQDVIDVERPVRATLHDPDSGEVLEEVLTGVVDLVVREHGRVLVIEHKTSSRRYTDEQLRFDVQPTAYQLALRQEGVRDVGLRFQVVTKASKPVVQIEDVRRDDNDEEDFLRLAVGVLRAIDVGVSFPVRGWQCRSCPFRRRCQG